MNVSRRRRSCRLDVFLHGSLTLWISVMWRACFLDENLAWWSFKMKELTAIFSLKTHELSLSPMCVKGGIETVWSWEQKLAELSHGSQRLMAGANIWHGPSWLHSLHNHMTEAETREWYALYKQEHSSSHFPTFFVSIYVSTYYKHTTIYALFLVMFPLVKAISEWATFLIFLFVQGHMSGIS